MLSELLELIVARIYHRIKLLVLLLDILVLENQLPHAGSKQLEFVVAFSHVNLNFGAKL